ncbi:unnamed protein product, partial [Pylaiella littoralis]
MDDQRSRPVMIFPVVRNMPPVASMIANMQEKIDSLKASLHAVNGRLSALEAETAAHDEEDSEKETVRKAAKIIKAVAHPCAKANNTWVFEQAGGKNELDCPTPAVEYAKNVPPLLVTFVDVLMNEQGPGCDEDGGSESDDCDDED